jgi:hypothetical protein
MMCDVCKTDKTSTTLQPSRSQLIFGGFPARYENRCDQCEKELGKRLSAMIERDS